LSQVVAVLRAVRERLDDPRAWVQGHWAARRDGRGVILPTASALAQGLGPNCFCLGEAINRALIKLDVGAAFTVLRSDVEGELLDELRGRGVHVNAVYLWNDARSTAHADVIELLETTISRLEAA
jgi:hypothetical protein